LLGKWPGWGASMKFKAERITVTSGTETPKSIWDFLEAMPLSKVEANVPYLGTLSFTWCVRVHYVGTHPHDLFTGKHLRMVQGNNDQDVVLQNVVQIQGRSTWMHATSSKELARLLSAAHAFEKG